MAVDLDPIFPLPMDLMSRLVVAGAMVALMVGSLRTTIDQGLVLPLKVYLGTM